jgi:hypothetical protein
MYTETYLIHKLYARILAQCRLMDFQKVSPFERAITAFLFVMDMGRVPFDFEFLYTASAPFGFGYGGTGLFGGSVLCHGSSTVCDPRLLW